MISTPFILLNMSISIRHLTSSDLGYFKQLIEVFVNVFETPSFVMPNDQHLQQVLEQANFHVFVVLSEDVVVGGLTGHVLQQYYTTAPLFYIYDLGVAPDRQRQGLGRMLIQRLNAYCRTQGIEETYVQTELNDEQAVNFYRKTNPTEMLEVAYFAYRLWCWVLELGWYFNVETLWHNVLTNAQARTKAPLVFKNRISVQTPFTFWQGGCMFVVTNSPMWPLFLNNKVVTTLVKSFVVWKRFL